jgi:hypothetical protein
VFSEMSSRGATGRVRVRHEWGEPRRGCQPARRGSPQPSMDLRSQPRLSSARVTASKFRCACDSGGVASPCPARGILKRVSARPAAHPRRQVEVVHPPNFIGRSYRQLEGPEVVTSDWAIRLFRSRPASHLLTRNHRPY